MNGEKSQRGRSHIKLLANLIYSFDAYGRAFGIDGALDISDNRWDSLKRALKIRHRITHPKNLTDLVISNQEWQLIENAKDWFNNNLTGLMDKSVAKLNSWARPKDDKKLP